jgi:hypothetical protein
MEINKMNAQLSKLAFEIVKEVRLNMKLAGGQLFLSSDIQDNIVSMIEEYINKGSTSHYLYSDWSKEITNCWTKKTDLFICPRCGYVYRLELIHGKGFICSECLTEWWRYGNSLYTYRKYYT